MEFLFYFSAAAVLPFWGAMIFAPRAAITAKLIASPYIIAPPVACYLAIALPHLPELWAALAYPSPGGFARMTGQPWAATLFWVYAGAFDLFVGRWIALDAAERGVPHRYVAPALVVAIGLGPVGWTIYMLARVATGTRPGPASLSDCAPRAR